LAIAFKLKAALAALAGLTGCVIGGRTIYHVDNPFQFLAHAASQGVIPVMVVGQPYPDRQAQVSAATVEAFERNFRSLGSPFRAAEPEAGTSTKIVVLFNVGDSPLARDICADPTRIVAGPRASRTSVRALYCGDGPYSEYSMSFPTPQSPEDPKFGEMMNKLAYFTVPREPNPERR
jgi:hypothetical protein